MTDEIELLRRYAEHRDEDAFATLVARCISLVYSAALRQLDGATHRAEDVTQTVFIQLARNAGAVSKRDDLVGWLYTATHHAAANLKRTESRRQLREEEANTMQHSAFESAGDVSWEQLRPVLDDALLELSDSDRRAILLRFFQEERFAELGRKLGLTEDAARMRVERSLDKLRQLLARRGITSTSAALATAFANHSTLAAPAGLVAAVTEAALASAASGAVVATTGFFMSTNSILTFTVALAAIGVATDKFDVISRLTGGTTTTAVAGESADPALVARKPWPAGAKPVQVAAVAPQAAPSAAPAPAQPEPPQIVLSEVLGPNNLYRDDVFGISATYPQGWSVRDAQRWGENNRQNTVWFTLDRGAGISSSMYYKLFPPAEAASRDRSVEGYFRETAETKQALRVATIPDYKNIPESFAFGEINGAPAMTYFATFTQGNKVMTEYFVRILGQKGYVMFFTTGELEAIRPLMPKIQQMAKSVRLP